MPSVTVGGSTHTVSPEQHAKIQAILGSTPFTPTVGQKYYYVAGTGLTGKRNWTNGRFDKMRLAMGNVFADRAAAKKASVKQQAYQRLAIKCAANGGSAASRTNSFVPYKTQSGQWSVGSYNQLNHPFGFGTDSACRAFLSGSTADLDTVFGS